MRLKTISRRTFLKSAGVAALAVTAAGVLTGCSSGSSSSKVPGTDVPESPVTSKNVKIIFADESGNGLPNGGDYYEHSVLKDAKVVDPTTIPADKIPEGYELADTTPVEIIENGNMVFAIVKVKQTPPEVDDRINVRVFLHLTNATKDDNVRELVVKMPGDAATISIDDIELPDDLVWAEGTKKGEYRPIGAAHFAVTRI